MLFSREFRISDFRFSILTFQNLQNAVLQRGVSWGPESNLRKEDKVDTAIYTYIYIYSYIYAFILINLIKKYMYIYIYIYISIYTYN